MKASDKKFIENWKATKKAGKKKYIITHGLAFGLIIFVINTSMNYWGDWERMEWTSLLISLLISIILGGGLYGFVTWHMNEYLYKKKLKNKS
ncbi:hypothetical protein [Psychroflexus aestuariivivens]|uniref:hypothetical protein n=1 Tax=Psychroflexus aestuariivivens TaxID=1795040 RepID=UPI000FD87B05|nr:hypothetical protein [Psychroflexus aestuariivivens]